MLLTNKVAIVIGRDSGIGQAIVSSVTRPARQTIELAAGTRKRPVHDELAALLAEARGFLWKLGTAGRGANVIHLLQRRPAARRAAVRQLEAGIRGTATARHAPGLVRAVRHPSRAKAVQSPH